MKKSYTTVLIGLGNVAYKLGRDSTSGSSLSHCAAYHNNPQTTLIGGYSPELEHRVAFNQCTNVPTYSTLDSMLNALKPDIVSICSPTQFHASQLETCLKQAVPMVWLEKPMASNSHDSNKLCDRYLCQTAPQSKVLVNYQRRYTQSYTQLKNAIADNKYGNVINIEVRYSKGLLTNGSHMLDLLFFFFGEPDVEIIWKDSSCSDDVISKKSDTNPSFVLLMANKYKVFCIGSDAPYHNNDIVVTFDKARLSIIHGGMTIITEEKEEHELFKGFYRLKEIPENPITDNGFDFSFDKALADLIASHQEGRQPLSNPVTASASINLIDRILG